MTSSGLGGLGLEGIIGMSEPAGVGKAPPGEGKSGEISGDNTWEGKSVDGEGFVFVVGEEVESVGISGIVSDCEYDERIVENTEALQALIYLFHNPLLPKTYVGLSGAPQG
ncbi:hypothetical protein L195_g000120 [Trifolium pratense]|uniref:Uncharacterized protein n=1 Tax=Trifolium pratense TaxID=57577 RepID=A0A2K3NKZ1_TRIPR|nr:hypothetical protein L195_g000120 [Trifolium pratense]